ncbi:hypothetical protein ACS0TY_006589 [Phlomoides rotata]
MFDRVELKLRCYGLKYVVKYPHCSLKRHSTYADTEPSLEKPVWKSEVYIVPEIVMLATRHADLIEPRTVHASELLRLLRIDKQAFTELMEIYFVDGGIIISNLLEGRAHNLRKKIQESPISLQIEKCESELAIRLNCAANDGDLHCLRNFI